MGGPEGGEQGAHVAQLVKLAHLYDQSLVLTGHQLGQFADAGVSVKDSRHRLRPALKARIPSSPDSAGLRI